MADVISFVPMSEMPNRLYELRRQRGWSQQQVADKVGCAKMHISALERGIRDLTLPMMRRLADAFGVAPADLLSMASIRYPCDDGDLRQFVQHERSGELGRPPRPR